MQQLIQHSRPQPSLASTHSTEHSVSTTRVVQWERAQPGRARDQSQGAISAEWLRAACDWLPGGEMVWSPPMRDEDPGAKRGINFQLIVVWMITKGNNYSSDMMQIPV